MHNTRCGAPSAISKADIILLQLPCLWLMERKILVTVILTYYSILSKHQACTKLWLEMLALYSLVPIVPPPRQLPLQMHC